MSTDSDGGDAPARSGRATNSATRRRVTPGESSDSPSGDHAHRPDELLRFGVLHEEAARARPQRLEDVLVDLERREDQHPHRGVGLVGDDPAGGLDPVELRHADVHEHDVGPRAPHHRDRLGAVVGLAHHLDVVLGVEEDPESGSHERLVVGEGDADQPVSALIGSRAHTRKPPEKRGPASRCPPTASARSRMPAMPCPGAPDAPLLPRPSSVTSSSTDADP